MPPSFARICPPVSFWNFPSASALDPKIATVRTACPAMRNCLFIECPLHSSNEFLGQLPATYRPLKHGFERQGRGLVSEFDISSGDPNLVAASARFISSI